jgi:hypothetical protein
MADPQRVDVRQAPEQLVHVQLQAARWQHFYHFIANDAIVTFFESASCYCYFL